MSDDTRKELMNVDSIDYDTILKKATELFANQAGVGKTDANDLVSVELDKAKAKNLLEALENVISMSHSLDMLKANGRRFKRDKELDVLHNLFDTCELQAAFHKRNTTSLNHILMSLDPTAPEDVATSQALIGRNTEITSKMISAFKELILLERQSGSRPIGSNDGKGSASIMHIKGLESIKEEESLNDRIKNQKGSARRITLDEIKPDE